jgi:hypothetical protein
VYDAFYPGYGASWPSYFGSIAMTYEQASARGLVVRKYDGVEMPYRETVRGHFVTSLGTAETVAENREKFLEDFYAYQVSAVEEGQAGGVRSFIVPRQDDQAAADKLAGLLVRQGVEVDRAKNAFRACDRDFAAGSYVIDLAQPAKRLVRTLLDTDVPLDENFKADQEKRRAKALPDEIYDVTAWSLPLMMNVEIESCSSPVTGSLEPAGPDLFAPGAVTGPADAVAYLVPWGTASAIRLLGRALREGLAVKSTNEAFTHSGTRYPAGTLIFDAADNPDGLQKSLDGMAAETGADVVAVASTWVTDGPNFGSGKVVRMNAPRVAIAWDEPTSQYSAGNTRFVIERQFDYPVTAIRTSQLVEADLHRYQVIILPDTYDGYMATLGEAGAENLRAWVERGGVLVTVGAATAFAADPAANLLSIRREDAVVDDAVLESLPDESDDPDDPDDEEPKATIAGTLIENDEDYATLTTPAEAPPDAVGGVLLRARVDDDHWLGAGVKETIHVLARGSDIYTPTRLDAGVNVARFESAEDVLASGYLWDDNRRQLAYKPFAVAEPIGAGYVVAFTQDPNVRAYLDGLNVIFMNAIFRGAAHARPVR